jgi:lysophospholipase L1-like esterase
MYACLILAALAIEPLSLKDGDRVVFLGNTLIEREQHYGWWETALLARFPGKDLVVRNLGWDGDTVFGQGRVGYAYTRTGSPNVAVAYKHLVEHTLSVKPTVLFVAYGRNEAFEGPKGLPAFKAQLNKLLDDLAPTKARIVLLGPPAQGTMPAPLPAPEKANKHLRLYADAIAEVAKDRKLDYVDLYTLFGDIGKQGWSDNGVHLNEAGYKATAPLVMKALGLAEKADDNEKARQLIREKNELYFHRWRPQNETYLFGFRKHEQGKNGIEIPKFDPLIEAKEKAIRASWSK